MNKLLFGTAGIPRSTNPQGTAEGILRVAELGLGCMELEFVRSVYISDAYALEVAETAKNAGVTLSAHAPYYLNLNAHEEHKLHATKSYLYKSARTAAKCGAKSVIFHAGFYLGDEPEAVYQVIKKNLSEVLTRLKEDDINITLRPETMGKKTQFGSLEEVLRLSAELEGVLPCIDFSHLHARNGADNSYEEFRGTLERTAQVLGEEALKNMHFHASGIDYGLKGERKHLNFTESDFAYKDLSLALKNSGAGGLLICESPSIEEDALLLQSIYR